MARERYLVNAGEETINQDEIILQTKKEKRQNFWYYYKWYFVVGIIVAILLFSLIRSIVTQVDPDYEIAFMTQETYPEQLTDQLADYIEQYGEDLNGDGKVVVQMNCYQLYTGSSADQQDYNMVMAGSVKFTADTMMGSSMIFITDDLSFQNIASVNGDSFSFFVDKDTFERIDEEEKDADQVRIAFSDCKGLSGFSPSVDSDSVTTEQILENYFDNLSISVRVLEGTSLEDNEKINSYYESSKILFERIKNG